MEKYFKPIDQSLAASLLKKRDPASHKGNFGHAYLLAGQAGRMGAALMAATACCRCGAGLLTVDIPFDERGILQTALPEAMLVFRENATDLLPFNAAGAGPGLGTSKLAAQAFKTLLKQFSNKKLVVDADALNILSGQKKLLQLLPMDTILTPHPLEFDRLFGKHANHEVRMDKAIYLSKELDCVIVLKSHRTLVASKGNAWLNTTGNAGLAKGGSGDVLTGMITAFLAQDYLAADAACLAVYLHGLAADLTLNQQSPESMMATDVIGHLGLAFKTLYS